MFKSLSQCRYVATSSTHPVIPDVSKNRGSLQLDNGTYCMSAYIHIEAPALIFFSIMLSISYPTLAVTILALSPSLTDGRRIYKRDCVFTWPATDEDTCGTMSRDWLLDESVFKAMNPGIDCSKLVPGQEYCVTWDGAISIPPIVTSTSPPTSTKPSSTTLVTTTRSSSAPSGPALPSPVQSGVPSDCESRDRLTSSIRTNKVFAKVKSGT